MAYSISYKESSLLTPYEDWIKRNKPKLFYIKYVEMGTRALDKIDCVFMPKHNLLKIRQNTREHGFTVIARVKISSTTKKIKITSSECSSSRMTGEQDRWLYGKWRHEHGKTKMVKELINEYKEREILEKIAHNIFGKDYSFANLGGDKLLQDSFMNSFTFQEIDDLLPRKYTHGPWKLLGAYCDTTTDVAATKIQAAFRGWRVRMQYTLSTLEW